MLIVITINTDYIVFIRSRVQIAIISLRRLLWSMQFIFNAGVVMYPASLLCWQTMYDFI